MKIDLYILEHFFVCNFGFWPQLHLQNNCNDSADVEKKIVEVKECFLVGMFVILSTILRKKFRI